MIKEDYESAQSILRLSEKQLEKEMYLLQKEDPQREQLSLQKSLFSKNIQTNRSIYIEANKPCNLGDKVQIILNSGRKAIGVAHAFGILQDGNVHVVEYKQGKHSKYISAPNQSVKTL